MHQTFVRNIKTIMTTFKTKTNNCSIAWPHFSFPTLQYKSSELTVNVIYVLYCPLSIHFNQKIYYIWLFYAILLLLFFFFLFFFLQVFETPSFDDRSSIHNLYIIFLICIHITFLCDIKFQLKEKVFLFFFFIKKYKKKLYKHLYVIQKDRQSQIVK